MPPALDPAVARARFAAWVDRALREARDRGMTDRGIARDSGVATSTFHRWRTNQGTAMPQIDKVRAFCATVGMSFDEALGALGMTDDSPEPTPEVPLPREVQVIMRRLADPNVPEVEKDFIRRSLQMLAGQLRADERAEERARG